MIMGIQYPVAPLLITERASALSFIPISLSTVRTNAWKYNLPCHFTSITTVSHEFFLLLHLLHLIVCKFKSIASRVVDNVTSLSLVADVLPPCERVVTIAPSAIP